MTGFLKACEGRRPLVEPTEDEIININTTNTNLIRQLKLIAAYPFGVPEANRSEAVEIAVECMRMDDPKVKLIAAKLIAEFMKVNVAVFRSVATDQVQRHLGFDGQDNVKAEKFARLENMTDEELDVLEKLSERAGGSIPLPDGTNGTDND